MTALLLADLSAKMLDQQQTEKRTCTLDKLMVVQDRRVLFDQRFHPLSQPAGSLAAWFRHGQSMSSEKLLRGGHKSASCASQ